MKSREIYQDLFRMIDKDVVVLTPNRRLSAVLHEQYRFFQKEACWETATILPLPAWLSLLWQKYQSNVFNTRFALLNTLQEKFLWEKIIATTKQSEFLLQISETAVSVNAASNLLKQWCIETSHPLFETSEDSLALKTWVNLFEKTCEHNGWIENASLPAFLTNQITLGNIPLPATIVLVGFTEMTPQMTRLLNACKQKKVTIREITLIESARKVSKIALKEEEDEIRTMARWAKRTLEKNPDARIGCVVPALDKMRDRIWQLFSEVFADEKAPFNLSAGKKLSHYPVVDIALTLLSLYQGRITLRHFQMLLFSPFLGDSENERMKRAVFDGILRKKNIMDVDLKKLLNPADPLSLYTYLPRLAKRLSLFFQLIDENNEKQSYHYWAMFFSRLLTALGWPGERSINSQEHQVIQQWLALLQHFSTLDYVDEAVDFSVALSTLKKAVNAAIFQPQSPLVSIQILGLLEAAALPFDYLWITGMDDLSWPPKPAPHPFIPKKLQRERQMPHATAARELFFCESLLTQFKSCTTELILSYAIQAEELERQPSALIREVSAITLSHLELPSFQTTVNRIYLSRSLSSLTDNLAPALVVDQKIRGGVDIIKQQAICPFKAFSKWRLHAKSLENPTPGLRKIDRGKIVHRILELVWSELKHHAKLVSSSDEVLNNVISTAIHEAMSPYLDSYAQQKKYMALESKRLHQLLYEWLLIEKKRPPFVVCKVENEEDISLNQLSLTMRIDRIDQLEDGKKIIIDYKTAQYLSVQSWLESRPDEPQLPLYALSDMQHASAIAFAHVYPGEYGLKGISAYDIGIDGIKVIHDIPKMEDKSWQVQLAEWQEIFSQLAEDFYLGKAVVDPKNRLQDCEQCDLKPLCRIHEEVA